MSRNIRPLPLFLALLLVPAGLHAQNLTVGADDLFIELRADGGFHLFIWHNPDISSVLLTESTHDPLFREPSFAYRAAEWNPVNGDEIRLIDGVPIPREAGVFSLVSSTPVWHPSIGWAFHIYVPPVLLYGYPGGRHGEVHIGNGIFLNIRAFHYAHADYRGPFGDNPFMLQVMQEVAALPPQAAPPPILPPTLAPPPPPPGRRFVPETIEAFASLAGEDNTEFASNPAEMMVHIRAILEDADGDVDIVICLDVTGSMRPFFDQIRRELLSTVREMSAGFDSVRVGMVFFKDYFDDFLYRIVPFSQDFAALQRGINAINVGGGGDMPEAVHEALFAGATGLDWQSSTRIMILIGDAPPHPEPRGDVTRAMVDEQLLRQGIELFAIVLPHP